MATSKQLKEEALATIEKINDELVEGSSDDFNEKERKARNKQKLLDYVKLNNLMGTIPSQDYQNIVALYESTGKLVIPDTSRVVHAPYESENNKFTTTWEKILESDRKDQFKHSEIRYIEHILSDIQLLENYVAKHVKKRGKIVLKSSNTYCVISDCIYINSKIINNLSELKKNHNLAFTELKDFIRNDTFLNKSNKSVLLWDMLNGGRGTIFNSISFRYLKDTCYVRPDNTLYVNNSVITIEELRDDFPILFDKLINQIIQQNSALTYIESDRILLYQGNMYAGSLESWEQVKNIYPELYYKYEFEKMYRCLDESSDTAGMNTFYFYRWIGTAKEFIINDRKVYYKNKEIKTLEELIDKIDSWF